MSLPALTRACDARSMPDGAAVSLAWPITTAVFGDRFYVENTDRIAGIGVLGGGSSVGRKVAVEGTLTTLNGERLVQAWGVAQGSDAAVPSPWFMTNRSIGSGANTIGLLISTAGVVTARGNTFFYIDDGSRLDDGLGIGLGIRVDWPYADPAPANGAFVQVLAVSSCMQGTNGTARMLRPVSEASVHD